jgi:hypothetical protein
VAYGFQAKEHGGQAQDESAQALANAFVAFARLVQLDKVDLAYPRPSIPQNTTTA